ncbi:PREDICTED: general odorant-binding protein 83a-like [Ceratosolen solmsi marchali]|uniref:General odorant-binding protein 83a-like n=1 Tax=Ceratosolen solmsi marchali TaxID=326594 RepID=A0AAJ7E2S9_9HYME|nr:PREDICTED: general odorant-binding protein 83a-like [Ceratosolen solmsi marchali]
MDIDGLKNMVKPMSKSCKSKTGVSDELVQGTHNGEFPRDRKLMCYFKCISVLLKIMNKQGEVNTKTVENQINILANDEVAPRLKEVAKLCYETVERNEDACEYALDLAYCTFTKDSSVYFLP